MSMFVCKKCGAVLGCNLGRCGECQLSTALCLKLVTKLQDLDLNTMRCANHQEELPPSKCKVYEEPKTGRLL